MKPFLGTVKIELDIPITYEGREIRDMALDFSNVTGRKINLINREMQKQGTLINLVPSQNSEYCTRLGAVMAGIDYKIVEKFHIVDFDKIWACVGAYLNGANPQEWYNDYVNGEDDDKLSGEDFAECPDDEASDDFLDANE